MAFRAARDSANQVAGLTVILRGAFGELPTHYIPLCRSDCTYRPTVKGFPVVISHMEFHMNTLVLKYVPRLVG